MNFTERRKTRALRRAENRLTFAAYTRCMCGAGLAYRRGDKAWDCSDILLGLAIPSGRPGAVKHDDVYPFVFYEIKSENQPSAHGSTTRSEKVK